MDTINLLAAISSIASFLLGLVGLVTVWPAIVNLRLDAKAWAFYVSLREEAGIDIYRHAWQISPGSPNFKLAERLVDQGKLFRRAMGSYGLWVSDLERGGNPS